MWYNWSGVAVGVALDMGISKVGIGLGVVWSWLVWHWVWHDQSGH